MIAWFSKFLPQTVPQVLVNTSIAKHFLQLTLLSSPMSIRELTSIVPGDFRFSPESYSYDSFILKGKTYSEVLLQYFENDIAMPRV